MDSIRRTFAHLQYAFELSYDHILFWLVAWHNGNAFD